MARRPHDASHDAGAPAPGEETVAALDVEGSIPANLSGRYLCIAPQPIRAADDRARSTAVGGIVHAVALHADRAPSYRSRWVRTDATCLALGLEPVPGPEPTARDESSAGLIEFAGRIFSLSDGSLAYELTPDLETVGRVDLAGGARGVGAHPKIDPATGELHLISSPGEPTALLHVISPGGMTRRTRPIDDAPAAVRDFALTPDHIVLIADGFVGTAPRDERRPITWQPVDTTAPDPMTSRREDVLLLVADPQRNDRADGGWLVGLVHDEHADATSFIVLDAADPSSPGLATVRIPRPLPRDSRGLWSPTQI